MAFVVLAPMNIPFVKYQGTGNDFVVIDNRSLFFPHEDKKLIRRLTDRKFGVGADGLILIEEHDELDFRMRYYNPDGTESLCGNGSRCAVHYAHKLGIIGSVTTFETTDGVHQARISADIVHFSLHDTACATHRADGLFIDNGSPHHISFVEDMNKVDVQDAGRTIRYSPPYQPLGVNVNFVQVQGTNHLIVRTYERGVEAETLSCGTGVTAAALAATHKGLTPPVTVDTRGGQLQVDFCRAPDGSFRDIFLSGPAQKVFQGEIEINS